MRIKLEHYLSDAHIDAKIRNSQRQLSLEISAIAESAHDNLPLNLCLVLDCSGSMQGKPLETVKQAAISILEQLQPGDFISLIAFNHEAKTIVPCQSVANIAKITQRIDKLAANGGTAIDLGMKLGIKEISRRKRNTVSHLCLLSDGENEHGDDQRCLKFAKLAAEYKITINTLGFGEHWNQDDLIVELSAGTRLGTLKPITQVAPETIELPFKLEGNYFKIRIGDLMTDNVRILLINLYINQLFPGNHQIATVQVSYDNPTIGSENLFSPIFAIAINSQAEYYPQLSPQVQKSILLLAKYRQTQIAEAKLQAGDKLSATTMLQNAAKTALQLEDQTSATVLQNSATRLQKAGELSSKERKQTRLASKTSL